MPKIARRSSSREGATFVETLIALTGLIIMFGGLCFAHKYGTERILALQRARNQAWYRSLHECSGSQPILKDAVQDIMRGDVPVPDGIVPSASSASHSFSVAGLFGREPLSGTRTMSYMCNPEPSRAEPLREPIEWVVGLFL